MRFTITFLGTSQAIPTKTRNHPSVHVGFRDENILIDCGEGTQRQFRISGLNPCKLTRILITHWHGDHVLGLPGLIQTLALNNYQKTLRVYVPKKTRSIMSHLMKIFVLKNRIKIKVEEVDGKFFENDYFELHSHALEHNVPCNGYYIQEKDRLRIDKKKFTKLKLPNIPQIALLTQGKDIKINDLLIRSSDITYVEKGKKLSFVLDTRVCKNIKKISKDSDLLVIESTYSKKDSSLAKEYFHMTSEDAAKTAKVSNVSQLVLMHLSQRYEGKEHEILKEAKRIFPNTRIAHDFMELYV